MDKIKILTIFGTRPEGIKMAPLIKELQQCEYIESKVCITAQHKEMLKQVLDLFNITPDFNLNVMKERQSLIDITVETLKGLEVIFDEYLPHMVLVHGDTNTTFSATLAAFYSGIRVGHVEAGLRTFNKYLPYPEEMNRRLTSVLADLHFAPTSISKENLIKEGIEEKDIFITGNTIIDSLECTIEENFRFHTEPLNDLDYKNRKIIMVTAHRRENWGSGIENICKSIKVIVDEHEDVEVVFLVHLNPIVKEVVYKYLGNTDRIHLLSPLDTKETHNLMSKVRFIMTDSGGIQEEAPHLGKPVLVLRDLTERPEAVKAGTVKVIGTEDKNIIRNCEELLYNEDRYMAMSNAVNPYGDGKASRHIINSILHYYGVIEKRPQDLLL